MEKYNEIVSYWRSLSDEKWETVRALMEKNRHADALFFCHLTLEAELKAAVVSATREHAPFVHDLSKLALLSTLSFSDEQNSELAEVSTFNIAGRYDDIKLMFHKKANKEFTEEHVNQVKELRLWIRKNIQTER